MPDCTLMDIAQKMPLKSELEDVHSYGPERITKYEEEILKIANGKW